MLTGFKVFGVVALAVLAVAACKPRQDAVPESEAPGVSDVTSPAPSETPPAIAATGEVCGGLPNIACNPGDFCKKPTGVCTVTDTQGVCTKQGKICTADQKPVCGCDGKTYANACKADNAGVSIEAEGECKKG